MSEDATFEDGGEAPLRLKALDADESVMVIEDVMAVKSQGVDPSDADMVYSLLSMAFHPSEDGMGRLELTLAGDGAVAIDVEALEVVLRDVTRPYVAPSKQAPNHDA